MRIPTPNSREEIKSKSETTVLQQLQTKTRRSLTMIADLTDDSLAKCNPQSNSPLYKLPRELRDLIFGFATAAYEDPEQKYSSTAYYYRPGHMAKHRSCTNLLLTCRRVWLEASQLPLQQAEHAFWFQRGPYDTHGEAGCHNNVLDEHGRYSKLLRSLTSSNLRNLQHIHFFLQMHQLDGMRNPYRQYLPTFFPDMSSLAYKHLRLKLFTITIRHSDWRNWERDEQLSLPVGAIQNLLNAQPFAVDEFRLELETLEAKKDQLQRIIDDLAYLEGSRKYIDLSDHSCQTVSSLLIKGEPQVWHWTGPSRINDEDREIYKDMDRLRYLVAVLTWQSVKSQASDFPPESIRPLPEPRDRAGDLGRLRRTGRGWANLSSDEKHRWIWYCSNENARGIESERRALFEKYVGDVEAKKVLKEWSAKGSLLKFES